MIEQKLPEETSHGFTDVFCAYEEVCALYLILCAGAQELRSKYMESPEGRENGYEGGLPVPVWKIAEYMGLTIQERNLSILDVATSPVSIGMLMGKLDYGDPQKPIIHLENGISSSRKSYVVAHELGHFWMKELYKGAPEPECCSDTRLSVRYIEMLSDAFSAFLLLPIGALFQKEQEFIDLHPQRPVNLEEMLADVARDANVPYYYVLTGYEYIKAIICCVRAEPEDRKHFDAKLKAYLTGYFQNLRKQVDGIREEINRIDSIFFA